MAHPSIHRSVSAALYVGTPCGWMDRSITAERYPSLVPSVSRQGRLAVYQTIGRRANRHNESHYSCHLRTPTLTRTDRERESAHKNPVPHPVCLPPSRWPAIQSVSGWTQAMSAIDTADRCKGKAHRQTEVGPLGCLSISRAAAICRQTNTTGLFVWLSVCLSVRA